MNSSWFELEGPYTDAAGVKLKIHGRMGQTGDYHLTKNDVTYLLEFIDGHVTAAQPADNIAFPLYGTLVQISGEEWLELVDALGGVAGQGGWQPQFVA